MALRTKGSEDTNLGRALESVQLEGLCVSRPARASEDQRRHGVANSQSWVCPGPNSAIKCTCEKLCASPTHSPGGPTSSDPSDPPASAQDTHSAFCGDHRAILSVVCTEKLPKPNITINNSQPMEGEDSLALTCEPEISYATYLWKINSQRIPDGDRLKLSNNNRTLTLFSVTRNDTGPYECETQNPVSASRSDPLTLNISCE